MRFLDGLGLDRCLRDIVLDAIRDLWAGRRCPTAQQFMHLFNKYVTPLGSPRRDRLDHRALTAGKRFAGAASMDDCIKAAVGAAYLIEQGHKGNSRARQETNMPKS